ncbi:hypothetical protein [Pseudomonas sp. BP8]|uniref:hypothetical protein n=1 Tax=Pseudomonas sp. BP8 TaxID=2817864 RepID=UPI001AE35D5E|nr:hypothetical protein [Pseudomonas sp. BP8]MBP2261117.1 hypothetical protein [Pseudomonas sp. BP8]HDS1734900.1 hypothetical protein [Pseudomonas putida]
MNAAQLRLINELEQLSAAIDSSIPADSVFSIAHGNWSFPSMTSADIVSVVNEIKSMLTKDVDEARFEQDNALQSFFDRIQFLRVNTVTQLWSNPQLAIPAVMFTLDALKRALNRVLRNDNVQDLQKQARVAGRLLQSAEAKTKDITRRSDDLEILIQRIEAASEAAIQLPEDLEVVRDGRDRLVLLLKDAEADCAQVRASLKQVETTQKDLAKVAVDTADVVKKADAAYSAATSQGLAAAFAERSVDLGVSMKLWVVGLLVSLAAGSYFGSSQLSRLADLIKTPSASDTAIIINLLLSVLSVGAPIWFAWLSTKQIGQCFRLSEDYGFKASVSKAYEGYRKEASTIDPALQVELLRSALARLDEQPLRFVAPESHGSPWQEILSSDLIKDAIKTVPNFSGQLTGFVSGLLAREKSKSGAGASKSSD